MALKRIGNFDSPTYVTGAPGFPKLLFVVEQPGTVRVLRGGHELGHPFLDINGLVSDDGGERGLLSIAFPPDYAQSGSFYVYYTDNSGNIRVEEFQRRSATRAAPSSRRTVITIPHPVNANHNGGQMQFLGSQGYRVIAHDRRSHGRSEQTWDGNNMDQYAADYAELLRRAYPRQAWGTPLPFRRVFAVAHRVVDA